MNKHGSDEIVAAAIKQHALPCVNTSAERGAYTASINDLYA